MDEVRLTKNICLYEVLTDVLIHMVMAFETG